MFWGLTLKSGKKYTQTIAKGFHLSQAAIDISSGSDEPVQVVLISENQSNILCTLRKNKVDQVPLDLNFATGEVISFTSNGNGTVHLTGYLVPELDDFDDDDDDLPQLGKEILDGEEASNDDDDDDESGDESDLDEIDEDEGDEDDSEDDEEEVIEPPKPKQIKLDKGKQNGVEKKEIVSKKKDKKKNKQKQQAQNEQQETSPKTAEKPLQHGVKIQDIRVGNGPEAKPGKKVQVLYEGRLKSNNKVFDSSKSGNGIKFGLGKGEVIKGWDIGLNGMKVGGKRRIICPPNAAYGAKGSPPYIPPNSTLVFEVELKSVN